MLRLEPFIDKKLADGLSVFTGEEARRTLNVSEEALAAAALRLVKKDKLAHPRRGFYLILRPEDRSAGAPDPAQWIAPLMEYQGLDYRVSLLRAAAWHGSSHQAAMVFQVVTPRQLRDFTIGRHRLQFIFQTQRVFSAVNQPRYLDRLKTPAGYAQVSGVELTLLDCARYPHDAGGINGVAQVAKDIGSKADPRRLAKIALAYEGSVVRRLGYLLDLAGHTKSSNALEPQARKAKTYVPLDPAVKVLVPGLAEQTEKVERWKLLLNDAVEIDT
jgi:predicted transcriptional regulator of viral defense system